MYLICGITRDGTELMLDVFRANLSEHRILDDSKCPVAETGVAYTPKTAALMRRIGKEELPSVGWVTPVGLRNSNPVYIDGVVLVIQGPGAGSASPPPQVFTSLVNVLADWFRENPEVPLYAVKYTELLRSPKRVLTELGKSSWLNEGLLKGVSCAEEARCQAGRDLALCEIECEVSRMLSKRSWVELRKNLPLTDTRMVAGGCRC